MSEMIEDEEIAKRNKILFESVPEHLVRILRPFQTTKKVSKQWDRSKYTTTTGVEKNMAMFEKLYQMTGFADKGQVIEIIQGFNLSGEEPPSGFLKDPLTKIILTF